MIQSRWTTWTSYGKIPRNIAMFRALGHISYSNRKTWKTTAFATLIISQQRAQCCTQSLPQGPVQSLVSFGIAMWASWLTNYCSLIVPTAERGVVVPNSAQTSSWATNVTVPGRNLSLTCPKIHWLSYTAPLRGVIKRRAACGRL